MGPVESVRKRWMLRRRIKHARLTETIFELKNTTRVSTAAELISGSSGFSTLWMEERTMLPVARNPMIPGETAFGAHVPGWVLDHAPYESLDVYAVGHDNCLLWPTWGVVMTRPGVLLGPALRAARWKSPDLTQIPGIYAVSGRPHVNIEGLTRRKLNGAYLVLNHWGGKNYGHFLFDSLPGVFWFRREILRGSLRIVTSPLQNWQRDFLRLLDIADESVEIVVDDLCQCERLIWPSLLHDNVNQPAPLTRLLGDWLKAAAKAEAEESTPEFVYISRRKQQSRQMANDAQLAAELEKRGFVVVCPEDLPIERQIRTFSRARCIVGETGAALANVLFSPPSCKVIEIMPEIKTSAWIKRLCGLLDMDWYCVCAEVPSDQRTVSEVDGVRYDNLVFSYEVDVESVIRACDHARRLC